MVEEFPACDNLCSYQQSLLLTIPHNRCEGKQSITDHRCEPDVKHVAEMFLAECAKSESTHIKICSCVLKNQSFTREDDYDPNRKDSRGHPWRKHAHTQMKRCQTLLDLHSYMMDIGSRPAEHAYKDWEDLDIVILTPPKNARMITLAETIVHALDAHGIKCKRHSSETVLDIINEFLEDVHPEDGRALLLEFNEKLFYYDRTDTLQTIIQTILSELFPTVRTMSIEH